MKNVEIYILPMAQIIAAGCVGVFQRSHLEANIAS